MDCNFRGGLRQLLLGNIMVSSFFLFLSEPVYTVGHIQYDIVHQILHCRGNVTVVIQFQRCSYFPATTIFAAVKPPNHYKPHPATLVDTKLTSQPLLIHKLETAQIRYIILPRTITFRPQWQIMQLNISFFHLMPLAASCLLFSLFNNSLPHISIGVLFIFYYWKVVNLANQPQWKKLARVDVTLTTTYKSCSVISIFTQCNALYWEPCKYWNWSCCNQACCVSFEMATSLSWPALTRFSNSNNSFFALPPYCDSAT